MTRPKTIVEVGAEEGVHTRRLLAYALSHRAHLHVIDPVPRFDPVAVRDAYGKFSTVYEQLSHDVLPSIKDPDVVLLDGDHNWYSIFEELRILDRTCRNWPLTFAHDVEWPYGRRDMYYAPDRIPAERRQPYAYLGILPGKSRLSPKGANKALANAKHEGGPRNGVLTGIEDFLKETRRDLALFLASGNNGLAIVVDRERLRELDFCAVLRRVLDGRAAAKLSPRYATTALP
ncbi:MAG TPA: class I SAM-dependent methyltransferase [Conexibacter sp.]|nr:class I SAM-dependent methyltransferase [Conexibacter sp.]